MENITDKISNITLKDCTNYEKNSSQSDQDEKSKLTIDSSNMNKKSDTSGIPIDSGLQFLVQLVENEVDLSKMIKDIEENGTQDLKKRINVDFEGINLSKHGKVCLGQFHISGTHLVYVVDFVAIKDPFSSYDARLKKIMESDKYVKVFFDPRNDIDAIAYQFNVKSTRNVVCLQVAEVAYRRRKGLRVSFVMGLRKIMAEHIQLYGVQQRNMLELKGNGCKIFAPEHGGRYEVFAERPLLKELLLYSAIDVYYFDVLYRVLYDSLPAVTKYKVDKESTSRLLEYLKPGYNPKGRDKSIAPRLY